MFFSFLHNTDKRFAPVIDDIKNQRAIVLSPDCDTIVLSEIILNNGYAETKEDADFIASTIVHRQKELGRLPSLFDPTEKTFRSNTRFFGQIRVKSYQKGYMLHARSLVKGPMWIL
jgi:hypothetical protein